MKVTKFLWVFIAAMTAVFMQGDLDASDALGSHITVDPPSADLHKPLAADPPTVGGDSQNGPYLCQKELRSLDDQTHALTGKAVNSVHRGDYDTAIRYYQDALKITPNDRGIQLALGHVLYLRDKQQGQTKPNPKVEVLLDALEYGKGDWETSIDYLKNALEAEKDETTAQAMRDALNYTEGLYGYHQYEESMKEAQVEKEMNDMFTEFALRPATMRELRQGFKSIEEGDYQQSIQSFESALAMNPNDSRIRDILSYAEGLHFGQYNRMKRWAEQQQLEYEKLRVEAHNHEAEAQRALEQSQNALRLSEQLNDEEAAGISRKAISIARSALAKAQSMLSLADARLQAVEKARTMGSKGRMGVASVVKGNVYRKTAKGWAAFDGSIPLAAGDELQTGQDGFAEFVLTDGSTVQIGPKSTLILHSIGEKRSVYELLKGRFHAEMSCLKMAGRLCRQIRTGPGFTVAVRGTELDIDTVPAGPTKITVMGGLVEISDKRSGKKIEAGKGEQVVITAEGDVKGPAPIELRSIEHWWEE